MTAPPPAFTAVSARRGFARPPVAPPPVSKPQPAKMDWPQPVREYVQRAFAPERGIPGIHRGEMESKLKEVISEAAENNTLHAVNWEAFPLPQALIQSERAKTLGVASRVPQEQTLPARQGSSNVTNGSAKKRKSAEMDKAVREEESAPPWRKANGRNVFEDRITYPNQGQADRAEKRQRQKMEEEPLKGPGKYQANLENRRQRFGAGKPGNRSPPPWDKPRHESPPAREGPVVGTCQNIEKNYLRLTAPPKAEIVRPLPVLRRTLEHLKMKWKTERNYSYICDQFKSLRQDLTVQHLKNEFTVDVYEIHARIALEKGDLGEYNQCQTQLRALYSQNLGGHPEEYLAYRILYFIHTCNRTGLNDVLADLSTKDKAVPAVKHALDVRSALALGNYHKFFRLYLGTPNMGAYLVDMFIERERLAALANICKAHKIVKLRYLTEELAFESDTDCAQFLCDHGAQEQLQPRDDEPVFLAGKSFEIFETARRAAFRRVDIKGQI